MRVSWFVPFRAGCQPYWLLPLPAALFGVRPLNADHHPIFDGLATLTDNQRAWFSPISPYLQAINGLNPTIPSGGSVAYRSCRFRPV